MEGTWKGLLGPVINYSCGSETSKLRSAFRKTYAEAGEKHARILTRDRQRPWMFLDGRHHRPRVNDDKRWAESPSRTRSPHQLPSSSVGHSNHSMVTFGCEKRFTSIWCRQ